MALNDMINQQSIRYGLPITVGITGHRDIKNSDKIIEILREQMQAVQQQFPDTPLYALSALAEGADRFFADQALSMQGWELHVILPMQPEIYQEDFIDDASKAEFKRFCTAAQSCTIVHPVVPGSEEQIKQQGGLHRDLQYAKAGIFMARRSHILMAIWDGEQPRGLGGTAQIIQFRETGNLSINFDEKEIKGLTPAVKDLLLPVNPLYAAEIGLVCKIFCERMTVSENQGEVVARRLYEVEWTEGADSKPNLPELLNSFPGKKTAHADDIVSELRQMNELNKKINNYAAENPGILNSIPDYADVDIKFKTPVLATRCLLDKMITTRTQAIRRRMKFVFLAIAMYLLASSRSPGDSEDWVTISIILSLLILLCISVVIKKIGLIKENSELSYKRSVVEGLRIQDYWNISGIQKAVFLNYPRQENRLFYKIRLALQGNCLSSSTQDGFDEAVEHVKERWIDDQILYYKKSIKLKTDFSERFSKASIVLFFAGVVLLACVAIKNLFAWFGVMADQWILCAHIVEHISEILIGYSALAVTYLEFSGVAEDIEDYERISEVFKAAQVALKSHVNEMEKAEIKKDFIRYDIRSIIYALGVDVLNGDTARWFKRSSRKKIKLGE